MNQRSCDSSPYRQIFFKGLSLMCSLENQCVSLLSKMTLSLPGVTPKLPIWTLGNLYLHPLKIVMSISAPFCFLKTGASCSPNGYISNVGNRNLDRSCNTLTASYSPSSGCDAFFTLNSYHCPIQSTNVPP